jgi:acetylornithine deacetylase/succinyl-diaminopimelate desuccinylase family protein
MSEQNSFELDNLLDQVRLIDVVKLTSELVKIPSCSETDFHENDVALYICNLLRENGLQADLSEALPGRFNVISVIKGRGEGPSLMLCGHMDTVPAYDMKDHLSGSVIDGVLHGRGACDMKGPLTAMLAAFIAVKQSGVALAGDLVFAAVIDEEETGKGVEHLAKHGPFVDAAVIGEPTNMQLALGHKGLEWISITVIGKKVHGGRMHEGINAIEMASRLIQKIYAEYVPILDTREHPILGKPTINIGKIEGGDQPSTVAGSCTISIDRRRVPEETQDQVYDELEYLISALHEVDSRFTANLTSYFPMSSLMDHKPFCTALDDPLAVSALFCMNQLSMENTTPTVFPAWTDAGILAGFTQAKCIVIGPGDLALAHTANESIEISQIEQAAQFYAALAFAYCNKNR